MSPGLPARRATLVTDPSRDLPAICRSGSWFHSALVLIALFVADPSTADTSPPFDLYLGPGYVSGVDAASGSALAAPIPVALGPGYALPVVGGTHAAVGALSFPLRLELMREVFAASHPFILDARLVPPGGVAAPLGLTAAPEGCDGRVRLDWVDTASDETGYVVEWKPTGFPEIYWSRMASTLPANETTFIDRPLLGLGTTYRVRAVRGTAFSAASNESNARSGRSQPGPPGRVDVKRLGDGKGLRIRVWPPGDAATWSPGEQVTIERASSPEFSAGVIAIGPQTPTSVPYEEDIDDPGPGLWHVRAKIVDCNGNLGAETLAPRAVSRRQAPVVLVHGWTAQGDVWKPLWDTELIENGVTRVARISFDCKYGTWFEWAAELRDYVVEKLEPGGDWQDDEGVDLVAHSQGGLASRSYIEEIGLGSPRLLPGQQAVRTLFMLATPNHGAKKAGLARLVNPWIDADCKSYSYAVHHLKEDSPRLLQLNFRSDRVQDSMCDGGPEEVRGKAGVTYYTLAGSSTLGLGVGCTLPGDAARVRCKWDWAKTRASRFPCPDDYVVPVLSVRMRSVPRAQQWIDYEVVPERLAHSSGAGWVTAGDDILGVQSVARFVAKRLRGEDLRSQGAGEAVVASREIPEDDGAAGAVRPTLLASTRRTASSGESHEMPVRVDSVKTLIVFLEWEGAPGSIELEDPTGAIHTVGSAASSALVRVVQDSILASTAFEITDPMPGAWKARVGGPAQSTGTPYVLDWVGEYTPVRLEGWREGEGAVSPGSPVTLRAGLTGSAGLDSISVHVRIRYEGVGGAVEELVPLTPTGPNVVPGRSEFVATWLSPAVDAPASLIFSASYRDSRGRNGERAAEAEIELRHRADLELSDLRGVPLPMLVGQMGELSVMVRNHGTLPADSIAIEFSDRSTSEILGQAYASVLAGDSTVTRLLWTPGTWGDHEIEARLRFSGTEGGLDDDLAVGIVTVAGTGVASTKADSTALVARLSFGLPRPNPFVQDVLFSYQLPGPGLVDLRIHDVRGRCVRRLESGVREQGPAMVVWDGRDDRGVNVASGVYFARLVTPAGVLVRRVVRVR